MASAVKQQKYDFDDFCLLVKDKQQADLINGVIHMASPDNLDANRLTIWLAGLVDDYASLRNLGEVFTSRAAFRCDAFTAPEPDIAFVLRHRLHLKRRGYFEGPPDLAMEIVSPESIERDYHTKKRLYARYGIAEYWIVDEVKRHVHVFRPGSSGKYREIRSRRGRLHSDVLTGFWLNPEWLWQRPRPLKNAVLQEIVEAAG